MPPLAGWPSSSRSNWRLLRSPPSRNAVQPLGNGVSLCFTGSVDGDSAERILVMGAGVALLADDGDHAVVILAVAVAVLVLDRLDLGGVSRDFDLVALGAIEVPDYIVTDGVDPVVVSGVVLAGAATSRWSASLTCVATISSLGVSWSFRSGWVGASATGDGVVDRLERCRSVAKIGSCRLGGPFARIRPAEQYVVAGAAIHPVGTEAADEKISAGTAGEVVVARAAPHLVVAGAAIERVAAGHAGERVFLSTPEQGVAAGCPV